MNKNRSKMLLKISFVFAICFMLMGSAVYAEINPDPVIGSGWGDTLQNILGTVLNSTGGVLLMPIVRLINSFGLIIFAVLYILFFALGVSEGVAFPFPDQIVFNKISFLDPNFINPAENSVAKQLFSIIKNMYSSFFVLAGTIFVIAAMIIGIKLAISSIAAQKAQYKQALNTWIVGIVLLFTVHYLLAGLFYLNEQIVSVVSVKANQTKVTMSITDIIPRLWKSSKKCIRRG